MVFCLKAIFKDFNESFESKNIKMKKTAIVFMRLQNLTSHSTQIGKGLICVFFLNIEIFRFPTKFPLI